MKIAYYTSSLDSNVQNLPNRYVWSVKQKRAFHRILSGLRRASGLREEIRFMTLTSSPKSDYSKLNAHFQTLRKRILRTFNRKIEYFKIKTNEGKGVLHVLFRGPYIPQSWLSKNWQQIHKAKIVDIRACFRKKKRLTTYLIHAYYSCKQSYERMSWSWRWVFKGFVGYWELFKYKWLAKGRSIKQVIRAWEGFLSKRTLFYDVVCLNGNG